MRRSFPIHAAAFAALLLVGFGAAPEPAAAAPQGVKQGKQLPTSAVKASWYGGRHHGQPTASGERFDRRGLTAAHPWLPFGTIVKVTNLRNGRHVLVRINDRGAFYPRREIDLSEGAARRLGMIRAGVAKVRVSLAGRDEMEEARRMPAAGDLGTSIAELKGR